MRLRNPVFENQKLHALFVLCKVKCADDPSMICRVFLVPNKEDGPHKLVFWVVHKGSVEVDRVDRQRKQVNRQDIHHHKH